jgi:hypothetical protein
LKRSAAIFSLLMVCQFVASGCSLKCDTGATGYLYYSRGQPEPQACVDHDQLVEEQLQQLAKMEEEEQKEAQEKAARELLAESPVHDEQKLRQDLAVVKTLTPKQLDAIRDVGNKVDLTADEDKALASITQDQRHALSQLLAFFAWLKDREAQAQQAADQAREEQEREQDRANLAYYQALMAQAASEQAQAAQSQANASWRQQRCLQRLSLGWPCY